MDACGIGGPDQGSHILGVLELIQEQQKGHFSPAFHLGQHRIQVLEGHRRSLGCYALMPHPVGQPVQHFPRNFFHRDLPSFRQSQDLTETAPVGSLLDQYFVKGALAAQGFPHGIPSHDDIFHLSS